MSANNGHQSKRLLSTQEAADIYGFSAESMRRRAREGVIPYVRIGKLMKFRESDLDAYFAANVHPARP